MYYKFIIQVLLFFLFIISCSDETITEPETQQHELNEYEEDVLAELNKFITPLAGTSPSLTESDLAVFDQLASAQVIGLGEATHGTKEFFDMKHRIFRYLVENHGYQIFGFEADMGECIYIDRFITKGIGSLDEVMKKMHFWTWRTLEVRDLILWMKEYNQGKNDQDQIHLLGVDCQFATYNKALIEEYLDNYDTESPDYITTILSEINSMTYQQRDSIDSEQKILLQVKCDSVYNYFETNSVSLIAKSGDFEYKLIVRLIEQSKQFLDVITDGSNTYRDFYMAKNTIWLTTLLNGYTKVVSWAHNGHINKDPRYNPQGNFLSQELDSDYKAIGFSFNQGTFQAVKYNRNTNNFSGLMQHNITKTPPRESYNYLFYATIPEDFILIFSNIPKSNSLHTWLNTEHKFISIGALYNIDDYESYYYNMNLYLIFDAIIHIENTTSAIKY